MFKGWFFLIYWFYFIWLMFWLIRNIVMVWFVVVRIVIMVFSVSLRGRLGRGWLLNVDNIIIRFMRRIMFRRYYISFGVYEVVFWSYVCFDCFFREVCMWVFLLLLCFLFVILLVCVWNILMFFFVLNVVCDMMIFGFVIVVINEVV